MEEHKNKMGDNGFYWFFAVVECCNDPEKLGRVLIRVLGDHTQDLGLIPTEDLPWAMPMMPINTASMNGIGDSPTGLVKGSWVVGFYRDGRSKQQPIIIGSIGGIPIVPADPAIGFNDPQECFPQADKLEEPDTNRLARGIAGKHVKEHEITKKRKEAVLTGIYSASTSWDEPETPYAAVYPYNKVWEGPYNPDCDECLWGHTEEWDSTPGAERYLRWHKTSQNFLEIHPDGTEVRKIYGKNFEIDLDGKNILIDGDYKVTIQGNKEERITGDLIQIVEGNNIQVTLKNFVQNVTEDHSTTVQGKTYRRALGNVYDISADNHFRVAATDINDVAGSQWKGISGSQSTLGVGSASPAAITPLILSSADSPHYPSINLKCDEVNQVKGIKQGKILPELPAFDIDADGMTATQVKITAAEIYVDAPFIHNTGWTRAPEVETPYALIDHAEINIIDTPLINANEVYTPALNAATGKITSIIASTASIGLTQTTTTSGGGAFVYPGPFPSEFIVEDPIIPPDTEITVSATLPDVVPIETVKIPIPIIPGDLYPDCP